MAELHLRGPHQAVGVLASQREGGRALVEDAEVGATVTVPVAGHRDVPGVTEHDRTQRAVGSAQPPRPGRGRPDTDLPQAVAVPVAGHRLVRSAAQRHVAGGSLAHAQREDTGVGCPDPEVGLAVAVPVAEHRLVRRGPQTHPLGRLAGPLDEELRALGPPVDHELGGGLADHVRRHRHVDAVGRALGGAVDERGTVEPRLDVLAVQALLVVQVRAGGVARRADRAELGGLVDVLTLDDVHLVEVGVDGGLAVAVIEHHVVAVALVRGRLGGRHHTGRGGHHRVTVVVGAVPVDGARARAVARTRGALPLLPAGEGHLVVGDRLRPRPGRETDQHHRADQRARTHRPQPRHGSSCRQGRTRSHPPQEGTAATFVTKVTTCRRVCHELHACCAIRVA